MNRKLLVMTVGILATTAGKAQYMTYNHDSPKQNQITVMETGAGALSPELYYTLLHNQYKKSAAGKNKLSFRTLAGVHFKRNIDRILPAGGTPEERERWTEYYNVYACAIDATRDAFLPNAQRKREYLRIYEDVARQNELLVGYLARRQNATVTGRLLNATDNRTLNKGSIVRNAMERWSELHRTVRGSQPDGGTGGGNGEGDETVNRGK